VESCAGASPRRISRNGGATKDTATDRFSLKKQSLAPRVPPHFGRVQHPTGLHKAHQAGGRSLAMKRLHRKEREGGVLEHDWA
jgi:hypothetical protein